MFNSKGDLEHEPGKSKSDDAEKASGHNGGFDLGKAVKQVGDAFGKAQNDMIERVTNVHVKQQYVASISPALASQYARGRDIVLSRTESGKSISDFSDLSAAEKKAAETYQRLHSDLPSKIPFYNKETLANDLDRDIVRKASSLSSSQARNQPQAIDSSISAKSAAISTASATSTRATLPVPSVPQKNTVSKDYTPGSPASASRGATDSKQETKPLAKPELKKPEAKQAEGKQVEPKLVETKEIDSKAAVSKPQDKVISSAVSSSAVPSPVVGNALLTALNNHSDEKALPAKFERGQAPSTLQRQVESNKPENKVALTVRNSESSGAKQHTAYIPTLSPTIKLVVLSQSNAVRIFQLETVPLVRHLYERINPATKVQINDRLAQARPQLDSPQLGRLHQDRAQQDKLIPDKPNINKTDNKPEARIAPPSTKGESRLIGNSPTRSNLPEGKTETKSQSSSSSETRPDFKSEAKFVAKPESKTDTKTEAKSEPKSDGKASNSKPDPKTENRSGSIAKTFPSPEPKANIDRAVKFDSAKPESAAGQKPLGFDTAEFNPAKPTKIGNAAPANAAGGQTEKLDSAKVVRGYRIKCEDVDQKYLTGPEIALSAIIALASVAKLRTDQSIWQADTGALVQTIDSANFATLVMPDRHRPADAAATIETDATSNSKSSDNADSSSHSPIGDSKQSAVVLRPRILIGINDSLVSLAEQLFNDAGIAWLILTLNSDLKALLIEGKTVVRVRSRQEIYIPVYQDIIDFQKIRTKEMTGSNLVTVVEESQVDREILDLTMAPMLGHNSNNIDPLG